MDSILTSCRGHGTVVARLKEGWQRRVLLKAHWTRTRCKAGDSRERECWRLWQPRDPRDHSAAAANGFYAQSWRKIPPHWSIGSWRLLAANRYCSRGAISAFACPAPNAVCFPPVQEQAPLCANRSRAMLMVSPSPGGRGGAPEELTDGHFECPPQSWNSRRTRPGRRAAAQC